LLPSEDIRRTFSHIGFICNAQNALANKQHLYITIEKGQSQEKILALSALSAGKFRLYLPDFEAK